MLYVFYERFFSRRMFLVKGCLSYVPLMGLWWFFFCVLNMGVPPSLSFFSVVFILIGVGSMSFSSLFFFGLLLFLSGVYRIYLYVGVIHGGRFFSYVSFLPLIREYLVFFCHSYPVLLIVMFLGSVFW
jgi:NADH:ubiquinone oxidoreductase subunit 4 (subunit M)